MANSVVKQGPWAAIRRLAASDRVSGLIMLGFALVGLVAANLPMTYHLFESIAETQIGIPYTNIDLPIGHWAQDGLLTIFFLTVGLELKQELTTGSLANPKAAAVPMLCAAGGMLMPPILFVIVAALFSQYGPGGVGNVVLPSTGSIVPFGEMAHGWAVPTATDIAFSLAVLALFAKGLPGSIRAFLMTLATVDDLLAIILIAVFFSSLNDWYWFLGIAACTAVWTVLVRMKRVPWIAVGVVGILAWVMMFEAGVHPTLAGVLVGLFTPSREMHGEATPRAERYASKLQPFSALLALPIFALFATGVHFAELTPELMLSPVVIALVVALVVGKPLGIIATAWVATHLGGLNMPKGLKVRDMIPTACACGIGFTVSFLIASLAYSNAELSAEARFGVLVGSLISALIAGILLSRQSKRFALETSAKMVHGQGADHETDTGHVIEEHAGTLADGTQSVTMDAFTPEEIAEMRAKRQQQAEESGRASNTIKEIIRWPRSRRRPRKPKSGRTPKRH